MQTLRGSLLGHDVAFIICGESHEDAIDLTRKNCIAEAEEGWIELEDVAQRPAEVGKPYKHKKGVTLEKAKAWAEEMLEEAAECEASDSDEDDVQPDGALLVFVPEDTSRPRKGKGQAFLHVLRSGESEQRGKKVPSSAIVFEWGDFDDEAREFNRRRREGDGPSVEEHDALIARRKQARLQDGVELLDDWLLRQATATDVHVEVVLEAPVPADEVELHREADVQPAPPAHKSLRALELDSDSDSDDDNDGGCDAYVDYLRRQVQGALQRERVHCIDPRELGEGSETRELRDSFQALLAAPLPDDLEAVELEQARARPAVPEEGEEEKDDDERSAPPLPSWEAFFGAAADLLYYHPEVKADYAPFLAGCFGDARKLFDFFDALYFGTVPDAVSTINLGADVRPMARIRSLAYQPDPTAPVQRRPKERPQIPVKAAPVDCYLKARGVEGPPRTWVSGVAAQLASHGDEAASIVMATRAAYTRAVEHLLSDPKNADKDGDYFEAWLREVYPTIFEDIETDDPAKLRVMDWAPSLEHPKSKKHRHDLKSIKIPGFKSAFEELRAIDLSSRVTNRRERALAKILVDGFQLRLVDVAAILRMALAVAKAPPGENVVVVLFAGLDHSNLVADFWRSHGFGAKGLPKKGVVGKEDFEEGEPRALALPPCLHKLADLFPLPK